MIWCIFQIVFFLQFTLKNIYEIGQGGVFFESKKISKKMSFDKNISTMLDYMDAKKYWFLDIDLEGGPL